MFYSEVLTPFTLWLSAALYSQGKARNGPLGSTTGSELFPQGFYACVCHLVREGLVSAEM